MLKECENFTRNNYEFDFSEVREDHYNGKDSIYRLNAEFDNYKGEKFKDMSEIQSNTAMNSIINDLNKIQLVPNRIFIYEHMVSVDWYPPYDLILNSLEEYKNLLMNFKRFINSIPFSTGVINTGMFSDDPNVYVDNKTLLFNDILGVRSKIEKIISPRNRIRIPEVKVLDIR